MACARIPLSLFSLFSTDIVNYKTMDIISVLDSKRFAGFVDVDVGFTSDLGVISKSRYYCQHLVFFMINLLFRQIKYVYVKNRRRAMHH